MSSLSLHLKSPARRVSLFFVLSFAFSWFGIAGNAFVESAAWPRPIFPLGPILAAPLVILLTEGRLGLKRWWRRITRLRAPLNIYAAATLIPATIILISVPLAIATGAHAPSIHDWAAFPAVLLILPILPLFGPLPEEPAFRGYAQVALGERVTPLMASLWIGLGVLIWHLPVLISGEIPWTIAIALPAVSVVYAWLYENGGSVWPLIALHTVQNVLGGAYVSQMFNRHDDLIWAAFLAGFYVAWAAIIAMRCGATLRSPGRGSLAASSPSGGCARR